MARKTQRKNIRETASLSRLASRQVETINWIDASSELPDAGSQVLVCFERNDCLDRDVTIAEYDDSDEESPWEVDGGLMHFGIVVFWAEMPWGPARSEERA